MPDPTPEVTEPVGAPEPIAQSTAWTSLSATEKRAKVLAVAAELFAREGVEFPMPELAKAVGVGVGSLYRQVGNKDDVLAELVVEHLDSFRRRFEEAAGGPDPVGTFFDIVRETAARTRENRVAKISFELQLEHENVREHRAASATALARLLDEAKAAGGVREDASVMDLRIMFRLGREAERITPGGGERIVELVLDGLRPEA